MTPEHRDYWNNFYSGRRSGDVPPQPSAFAEWTRDVLSPGDRVWEFGFGTARDSLYFAAHGHPVRGFDFAEAAVTQARDIAARRELDARFDVLDLNDEAQTTELVSSRAGGAGPVNIYGRFLIHSLTDAGRQHFLAMASGALQHGGLLLLEFRTGQDAEGIHLFGDEHFRTYLDPDHVVAEIEALGGSVRERQQGHGLAVYKSEDPHIARLVARWPSGAADVAR